MMRGDSSDPRRPPAPVPATPAPGIGTPPPGGAAPVVGAAGRAGRRGVWAAVVATVLVLGALLVVRSCDTVLGVRNPFSERTTVRSQPVLLESIKDLSRYQAATANM